MELNWINRFFNKEKVNNEWLKILNLSDWYQKHDLWYGNTYTELTWHKYHYHAMEK